MGVNCLGALSVLLRDVPRDLRDPGSDTWTSGAKTPGADEVVGLAVQGQQLEHALPRDLRDPGSDTWTSGGKDSGRGRLRARMGTVVGTPTPTPKLE